MSRWLPWWQSAVFICCCAGGEGGTERCSGRSPENGRWNPERGKGQPKINPYRAGWPGPHHTQHQIRRQCPFYDRIVWQYLNYPGRCTDHMIWQVIVFQKFIPVSVFKPLFCLKTVILTVTNQDISQENLIWQILSLDLAQILWHAASSCASPLLLCSTLVYE